MSDEARAWTERIEQAAHRMDALVTGLLDYSRLGRQNLLLEPVEWDHVVEDVLKQMRNEIAEQGAEVVAEPPFPRVRGHALTLTLALGNLLSNAFKFVPDSRRPRVRIRAEQGRLLGHAGAPAYGLVRLWVEDNGIGIAPEHRERIFGVFERLHLEKAYPGTGIGLAIVRRVVERMGGRVGVESELGRGSRFFIDLPGI